MKIDVLDSKLLTEAKAWYLCRGNLYDYLSELKQDFSSFSIQRRIVRNRFLDGLYKTIIDGEPIPAFTLTCQNAEIMKGHGIDLNLQNVEILDGLQRSFRLWFAYAVDKVIKDEELKDYGSLYSIIGDTDPAYLNVDFVTPTYLRKFFEKDENGKPYHESLIEAFKKFQINFTIWTGLSEAEIIKKMLILNAGQRPMSSTHQYELLFLRYFEHPDVSNNVPVRLYREKDVNYSLVKRGERQVGEFQLSSVIIALQSMIGQKPIRVSPSSLMRWDVDEMLDVDLTIQYFNSVYLTEFLNYLYNIDFALSQQGGEVTKWFGKDTTLSGVFAALGECFSSEKKEDVFELKRLDEFIAMIHDGLIDFHLDEFNKAYENLSSVRINVGEIVRKSIFQYTVAMIRSGNCNWGNAFESSLIRRP